MLRPRLYPSLINALKGVAAAMLSSLLVALLFAYTFRLPVPLAGYIGPFGDLNTYGHGVMDIIQSVLVAWLFYGIFGGFIIIALSGTVMGLLIGSRYAGSDGKSRVIILWSAAAGSIPVFILAVLDYLIGPW